MYIYFYANCETTTLFGCWNAACIYIFMRIARQQPWMLECRCTKVASFIEQSSFQVEDYKNKKSLLSFIVKTKKYTSEYRAYEEKTKKKHIPFRFEMKIKLKKNKERKKELNIYIMYQLLHDRRHFRYQNRELVDFICPGVSLLCRVDSSKCLPNSTIALKT
jgi:hypothetical protein